MNNLLQRFLTLNIKNVNIIRQVQTNASILENCSEIINNNPRNLELMRIAKKPKGYDLDDFDFGRSCYLRLKLRETRRQIQAEIHHYQNGLVLRVSTIDWCLRKFLYRSNHVISYYNLGRILGIRCLESGIWEIFCDLDTENSSKKIAFIKGLSETGLQLNESATYEEPQPSDLKRPAAKTWID